MKVDCPRTRLSLAPTRVNTRSHTPIVAAAAGTKLFAGIEDERFYFVHSYAVRTWELQVASQSAAPQVTWASDGTVALDANSTPATKDIVTGVEQVAPLFHLLNGDLCYANLDVDRVRTWNNFFTNNTRSARFRPWMPAAGNHEIEKSNGPIGLDAFQAYFKVPSTETDPELAGLWYSFTVGSVHVIVLQNDDNCLQDGGDVYINGYSGGRQLAFLQKELAAARASRHVDWIVVAMHQVMISSSDANGADIGLRAKYGPLFDKYGVDLVLCGHEHDYERSLAVRGVVSGSETLTPNPVSSATDVIDSNHGTVHMILGGGGVSGTTNQSFFTDGTAKKDIFTRQINYKS